MKNSSKKRAIVIGIGVTSLATIAFTFLVGSTLNFQPILSETMEYTLVLDKTNAPTSSSSFTEVETSIKSSGGYSFDLVYSSAKTLTDGHAVLADGSTVVRKNGDTVRGVDQVSATYSGGKLFARYAYSDGAFHEKEIPNDGSKLDLLKDYSFNYFEVEAVGEVNLTALTLKYSCSEGMVPEQGDVPVVMESNGAIVTGLRNSYNYDDREIIHVQPLGTTTIDKVLLNGKEVDEYSELGDGFYDFVVGKNDQIKVLTSVSQTPDFVVNVYSVDPDTGAISPINGGTYTIKGTSIDTSNKYYYKIDAPVINGFTATDGYRPNQDYVNVLKDDSLTNKGISFYYSKLAEATTDASTGYTTGNGSKDNPYLIKSTADWLYFVDNASSADTSYYKLTTSLDFTGCENNARKIHYGAVDKTAAGGTNGLNNTNGPVDANIVYFSGNFDGNNCAIRNMKLVDKNMVFGSTSYKYGSAPFAYVKAGATIKNLSTYGTSRTTHSYGRVSGIAAACDGVIENCNNYMDITYGDCNGSCAGIVAYTYGISASLEIRNCVNYGKINLQRNGTANGRGAGLLGYSLKTDKTHSLVDSNNFGKITSTQMYNGGLVADANSKLTNCNNFGDIEGNYAVTAATNSNTAGLQATKKATMTNCNNYGNIAITNTGTAVVSTVGGLMSSGSNGSSFTTCNNFGDITLTNSLDSVEKVNVCGIVYGPTTTMNYVSNFGTVHVNIGGNISGITTTSASTLTHVNNFGDIISDNAGTVIADFGGIIPNSGGSKTYEDVNNHGNIYTPTGISYTGGIVGRCSSSCTFTNCVNTGYVLGNSQVGGIIGYISNTSSLVVTLDGCINEGMISLRETGDYAGGIVGRTMGATAIIKNCVNNGCAKARNYVGGILGSGGNAANTYQNLTNNGIVIGADYVGGVIGSYTAGATVTDLFNYGKVTGTGTHVGNISGSPKVN